MKKLTHVSRAVSILGLLLLLKGNPSLVTAQTQGKPQGQKEETKSTRARRRTLGAPLAGDSKNCDSRGHETPLSIMSCGLVKPFVNNTDPTLTNTDTLMMVKRL